MKKIYSARIAASFLVRPILVMDICTIGLIKQREQIPQNDDENKKERLRQLISLAKSGKYKFSFILAIIEKATDVRHQLTKQQMVDRFMDDYRMIVGLIGSNNMLEKPKFLKFLIDIIMDENYSIEERAELKLKDYLELLNFYNTLGIKTDPAREELLVLAKKVTDYAEKLGINRGHPVVAICVASIYGCSDARRILKVNKKGEFNPSNALGDIQSFYRLARTKHVVQTNYPGSRVEFRTEDKALESMHTYYTATVSHELDGVLIYAIHNINDEKMFPLLFTKEMGLNIEERNALYALLDFRIPDEQSTS
ncbi:MULTISPECIES: hypothetical protein [Pectobacterium]|uniref:Uncharacterized protein n=1 Tax=Pectobacterium brasiliense TaxID=180957 RepID=A0AAE3BEI3_9GAMM|nr:MULTISPECIES: hypothetical protein [Pectobacterium]MBN3051847.1 hypothetical protein [Pectobacterium brasiliense]MCU1793461.1 hypothetical protein [Pectobacterium polaris]